MHRQSCDECGSATAVHASHCSRWFMEYRGVRSGPAIKLISFGYEHSEPFAIQVVDVRSRILDPAPLRVVADRSGLHRDARALILSLPGASDVVDELVADCVRAGVPWSIAVGSQRGRHRAPAVVEAVAARLRLVDLPVVVTHLHVEQE